MLSDQQLELLKEYCEQGGKLLIAGPFGIYNSDGSLRGNPEKIFGFSVSLKGMVPVEEGVFNWRSKRIALAPVAESYYLSDVEGDCQTVAQTADGKTLGVAGMKGNLIWLAGGVRSRGVDAAHYAFCISRWVDGQSVSAEAPAYAAGYIYDVPGAILSALADDEQQFELSSCDYLLEYLQKGNVRRFYLVNVAETLACPPEKISHGDIFRRFTEDALPDNPDLTLTWRVSDQESMPVQIKAYSPEFSGSKVLPFEFDGKNIVKIKIPAGIFSGYLEIEC